MNDGGSGFFTVKRPASYRQVVVNHLPWVLLSGAVLLGAFFLPLDSFPVRTCVFFRVTGYPCLSCGWTRGFVAMANGDWLAVIHDCPLIAVLYGLTALIFSRNMTALLLGVALERGAWLSLSGRRGRWVIGVACLLVLANWIYRLAMGLK